MEIINWKLVKHPMNWLVVFFMVFILMFALRMILGDDAPAGPQI